VITGFRRSVNEVFAPLGCYVVLIGSYWCCEKAYCLERQGSASPKLTAWTLIVRLIVSSSPRTDFLTLEVGRDRVSRNIGNYLPINSKYRPEQRRSQIFKFSHASSSLLSPFLFVLYSRQLCYLCR